MKPPTYCLKKILKANKITNVEPVELLKEKKSIYYLPSNAPSCDTESDPDF